MQKFACHSTLNNRMKAIILFVLFSLLLIPKVNSQQCGYEGINAFVINVHNRNAQEPVSGLKIYLVNENNEPYIEKVSYYDIRKKTTITRFDTLIFWENLKASKYKKLPQQYHRFYLKGAGNAYLIHLPEIPNYKVLGTDVPIYQARIVDVDGNKNGGYFTTRVIRLNYSHSVNICLSGILHENPNHRPDPGKIKRMDGGYFMPIDIDISYVRSIINDLPPKRYMYRTKTDTIKHKNTRDSLYSIREIEIKNFTTLITVQKIVFPERLWVGGGLILKIPEYGDFYNDNPSDIRDFRVLTQHYKGKDGRFHKKYLHYVYDETTERYSNDTLLDNYEDIEIEPVKGITRTVYSSDSIGVITSLYTLINRKWTLKSQSTVKRAKSFNQEIIAVDASNVNCLVWVHEFPHKTRVLRANEPYYYFFRDSFTYVNFCNTIVLLDNKQTNTMTFTRRLDAHDTGMVTYKDKISIGPDYISFHNTAINLRGLGRRDLNYIVIGQNLKPQKTREGNLQFWVNKFRDSSFFEVLTLDKDMNPMSFGLMRMNDTTHYGNWRFWDAEGNETYRIYSRRMLLLAKDYDSEAYQKIKAKVKIGDVWQNLPCYDYSEGSLVYLTNQMDSLKVYTTTATNTVKLKYKYYGDENYLQLYLLKADEYALPMNGSEMPVHLMEDKYRIQPDWVVFSKRNKGSYEQSNFIRYFKNTYPEVFSEVDLVFEGELIIDISRMAGIQKRQVLKRMIADSAIYCIAQLIQLPGGRITFGDRSGGLTINYNLSYDSVSTLMKTFGFISHGPITGTGNVYQFVYPSKLMDRSFFDKYSNACKHPDVMSGYLSFYSKVTHDIYKD